MPIRLGPTGPPPAALTERTWEDGGMSETAVELADLAEEAARNVGPYLTDAFLDPGRIDLKLDFHDVVTVHDKESQRRICATLFSGAPGSLIRGEEENGLLDRDGRARTATDDDVVWYVDPIDGTSNFATGFDHWCVSIAAARAGELVAAVIYQPTLEILYRADDSGAYRNGERLTVRRTPLQEGVVATEFPSPRVPDKQQAAADFTRLVGTARSTRRCGSTALALAEVAAGHFLATFNRGTHPWDVAAGILLVQRAGGFYVGCDDDGPLYRRDLALAPNFAAAATLDAANFCLDILGRPDLRASDGQDASRV
ncbi:MAG: inositol monophosphatase [Actinomycetaceae bacterium]|nr:inositol monophosphatase [Actinomycetaceae bacterium]